jgi:hypothetical protein
MKNIDVHNGIILNVVLRVSMLNVVVLSVIMLNVVVLSIWGIYGTC